MSESLYVYRCPKCGRTVRLPKGEYYCKVCGPAHRLVPVEKAYATLPKAGERIKVSFPITLPRDDDEAIIIILRPTPIGVGYLSMQIRKALAKDWETLDSGWGVIARYLNKEGLTTELEFEQIHLKAKE